MHPALVVGCVFPFNEYFGYWNEFITLGTDCIDNLWESLGSILGCVMHQDNAA